MDPEREREFTDLHFANLDKLGEDRVRLEHAKFTYGKPGSGSRLYDLTENWLMLQSLKRSEARADAIESNSRISLLTSRRALIVAIVALISTIIFNIISNMDKIISFLQKIGWMKPPDI